MACCLIGSLLLVLATDAVRRFRERVLGKTAPAPEQWRLTQRS